jgi:hypothetical protein
MNEDEYIGGGLYFTTAPDDRGHHSMTVITEDGEGIEIVLSQEIIEAMIVKLKGQLF